MLRKCILCNILKNKKNINFFETNQIFIKGPKTKQKIIKKYIYIKYYEKSWTTFGKLFVPY